MAEVITHYAVQKGYSTIAWIPEEQGSWALPLLHERISSGESPIPKAASQLKQVCEQLTNPVLAVLDREYGNAAWVLAQADIQADCLMRVRKNACLWSAPPAYSGRGRPRKHGQEMKLNDPETWMEADTTLEIDHHPQLGQVRVTQWRDLHFYRAAGHLVNLILIERTKPRGKSPGWTKGNTRTKPPRYPPVNFYNNSSLHLMFQNQ